METCTNTHTHMHANTHTDADLHSHAHIYSPDTHAHHTHTPLVSLKPNCPIREALQREHQHQCYVVNDAVCLFVCLFVCSFGVWHPILTQHLSLMQDHSAVSTMQSSSSSLNTHVCVCVCVLVHLCVSAMCLLHVEQNRTAESALTAALASRVRVSI